MSLGKNKMTYGEDRSNKVLTVIEDGMSANNVLIKQRMEEKYPDFFKTKSRRTGQIQSLVYYLRNTGRLEIN